MLIFENEILWFSFYLIIKIITILEYINKSKTFFCEV